MAGNSLVSAIQFLTLGRAASAPGKAAAWIPLVGAVLGAAGAGIYLTALRALPASAAPPLGALACVAFWTVAGRVPREGQFPYLLVAIAILGRWLALEFFDPAYFTTTGILTVCIAAQVVPRATMVGLAWASRPAGIGSGYAFSSTLTTPAAVAAVAQGIFAAFLCGIRAGLVLMVGALLISRLTRAHFYKRRGGVDADALGATEQLVEIFVLALFTCGACAW